MTGGKQQLAGCGKTALLATLLIPALSIGQTQSSGAESAARPNLLLIVGDDVGNETLSCYGLNDNTAKTPTLDDLCAIGVRTGAGAVD